MYNLRIRRLKNADVKQLSKWLYVPHVAKWYHDPIDWLNEVHGRFEHFSFINHFMAEVEGEPIGFCQFYPYSFSGESWHGNADINGAYSIDYLIGEVEYLGRGLGKAIVKALIEKVKTIESAKTIIVQPEEENKESCNTLLSCGFSFDELNKIFILKL